MAAPPRLRLKFRSGSMDWRDRLKSLFPDSNLRGRIRMELLEKSTEYRNDIMSDDDDAVKSSLLALLQRGNSAVEETSAKRRRVVPNFSIGDKMKMNFELKDCDIDKWEIGTWVQTAGMEKVMESFGGFPAEYYVRQEEINVFKRIWSYWESTLKPEHTPTQFTLLGSPGVGKSTFIVFLAFYMARLNSRSVLLLRRVKGSHTQGYKCAVLFQDDYCEVKFNSFPDINNDISMLLQEFPGLLYFVDGFPQAEVNQNYGLAGYLMLATSSQFRRKDDNPTEVVVLPAWQFCDLKEYAKEKKMFDDAEERSRERYYYSGGSLWMFCRDPLEMKERLRESLRGVGGTNQVVTLMGDHGGASDTQVDSLRRRYLDDRMDLKQYTGSNSKFVVDSGYVLRNLLVRCDKEQYEKVYNFTKAFGDPFHGWAFESYLHKLATSGGFTIQAKQYASNDRRVRYEIKCSHPTWEGTNELECKDSLRRWASNPNSNYWYPKYSRFPCIDCVSKVRKPTGAMVIAYIQITVAESLKVDRTWMDEIDEVFKEGYSERIYIVIQPQKVDSDLKLTLTGICEM